MKVLKLTAVRSTGDERSAVTLEAPYPANPWELRKPSDWTEYRESEKKALMLELQDQARAVFAARAQSITGSLSETAQRKPRLSVIRGGRRD